MIAESVRVCTRTRGEILQFFGMHALYITCDDGCCETRGLIGRGSMCWVYYQFFIIRLLKTEHFELWFGHVYFVKNLNLKFWNLRFSHILVDESGYEGIKCGWF